MRVFESPPPDWDKRAAFPTLGTAFAEVAATVGQRALYVEDRDAMALVLVRSLPIPGLRAWTARAKAYVSGGGARFVRDLVRGLGARGIAHVRIGDSVLGLPRADLEAAGVPLIVSHLLRHPVAQDSRELFRRLASRRRTALRRAEREGVTVSEVRTEAELREYYALAADTERRARARDIAIVAPWAYLRSIFGHLVPRRQAVFLLARRGDRPLAGATFLVSPQRMTYFHASSTRDPALTALQGPTAVIWHAMRVALMRGIASFDLGAVTPTNDPLHPHHSIFRFKREFGGYVEEICHGDLALSPWRHAFQERVMMPLWKRAHGVYLGGDGASEECGAEITSGIDVRWAGAPNERVTPRPAPVPWTVDDLIADIGALPAPVSDASRVSAMAFTRALHDAYGRATPGPAVAPTMDGGVAMTWHTEIDGREALVELVFVRDVIEFAVADGDDVTASDCLLVDGETRDQADVLREVVKRYVAVA